MFLRISRCCGSVVEQDVRGSIFRTKIINKKARRRSVCLYSGSYLAGRSKQIFVSSNLPLIGSKFQIS